MRYQIEAFPLSFSQIVFQKNDEGVRANCQMPYKNHPQGCPNYGKNWSCPPYSPLVEETKKNLSTYLYYWVIRIKIKANSHPLKIWARYRNSRNFQEITTYLNDFLEKLRDEHPLDQVYFCSECSICMEKGLTCSCPAAPCRYPKKMRISPESAGIDLFRTMNNLELKIEQTPIKYLQRIGLYASDEYLNFSKICENYKIYRKILEKIKGN